MQKHLKYLALPALVAGVLIFWKLGSIPNHLQNDEALAGLVAKKVTTIPFNPLKSYPDGDFPNWLDYVQHLSFSLLGTNLFSIRLHAALSSFLSVIVFYFFALSLLSFPPRCHSRESGNPRGKLQRESPN